MFACLDGQVSPGWFDAVTSFLFPINGFNGASCLGFRDILPNPHVLFHIFVSDLCERFFGLHVVSCLVVDCIN